tara:strand:- start:315 stop:590 length:276 start_codon:yes stop_codon:yes gene_type:complete
MLLKVCGSNLMFGCVKAIDENGNGATILVYENIHNFKLKSIPKCGEVFLCYKLHNSVFIPCKKLKEEHLLLRMLPISNDLLAYYFPVFACV